MTVITLTEVDKRFGRKEILRDVSLGIEEGRTYGLVGPNGAGKSVLLLLMCGLLRPSSGTATIDPRYLSRGRDYPDRFGVSINGPGYLAGRSARQNLADLAAIRKQVGEDRIDEVLEQVGLSSSSPLKARNFSLGMLQKLSLAQALLEHPAVLLLDEPFNALDAESVERLREILVAEKAKGTTIVFTSNRDSDIEMLSYEVLRVEGGRVTDG